jgi:hypothetical protein
MQAIEADAATDFDPTAIPAAQRKLVVSLLLVSTFVVVLNETALAVALPVLMRDLHTMAHDHFPPDNGSGHPCNRFPSSTT